MTAHPAAPLLAADLGRLPHTNARGEKGLVQIPGFRTAGMAEEQAAQSGLLAQAIAEAVIEDLDKHGYQVIAKSDIAAKVRAAADKQQGNRELTLYCNRCRQPVLKVDVTAPAPKLNVTVATLALQTHGQACR